MMIPSTAKEKEEQQWTSTSSLHQQKLQHPYPDSNCRPVSTTAAAATTTATIATAHKHITQEADNALLWASMLNENGRRSFMLEGLNEALVPRAMQDNCCTTSSGDTRRNRNVNGTPSINSLADDEDDDQQQPPLYHSSRRIKPESHGMFAPLPLETQIFTNLPAITITGDSSSSKISSFMDLLRQSDSTATTTTTTTAAAAAAEETHDMWIAHSSRLPAMLSQLLPSQSPPPSSSSSSSSHTTLDSNRKRVMMSECSPSSSSQSKRPHLQPGTSKKIQDDDEEPSKQLPSTDDLLSTTTTTSSSSSQLLIPKRPKIESNSSYPFKMQVRKEKLGERISALQQLVSPFGKTDTASVLLEAIGYIKFLHEQVQVLSSPYMKGVSNSSSRHHGDGKYSSWISSSPSSSEKEGEEDLRSRGLCLVPVTCTLQVANDNGADYWAPTIHGGSQLK